MDDFWFALFVSSFIIFFTTLASYLSRLGVKQKTVKNLTARDRIPSLPTFTANEVSEHQEKNKRLWASYKRGVYDMTDFISKHPGGDIILKASGTALESFWELYPVHYRSDVIRVLNTLRIGNLAETDLIKDKTQNSYKNDPKRHQLLSVRTQKPFTGETPPAMLTKSFFTLNEVFYVRNHFPVPQIEIEKYQLTVGGIALNEKTFSYEEIKGFEKIEKCVTLQCGGNRRTEMGKIKEAPGIPWTGGAIGHAIWGGAKLMDILKSCGFHFSKYENPEKFHIQFEGIDGPKEAFYGSSIPLIFLLNKNFTPLIVYEMNEEILPFDHGFPMRILLPGLIGARSVKWLGKIKISDEESSSIWQQLDYKIFGPSVTAENVDYSSAPSIMETPPNSYICSYPNESNVKAGMTLFNGWAYSGGGRKIVRVEVSINKGKSWEDAEITANDNNKWSWIHWEKKLELKKGEVELRVKAVDTGYNQQTENLENIWNYRGLLSNASHKIKLFVT